MPLDLKTIDEMINQADQNFQRNLDQLNDLKLVREIILHGSEREQKILALCSRMTIDNLNKIIKELGKTTQFY